MDHKNAAGNSRPIVIGIAGATNAGKTTVSRRLMEDFPGSDIVHQDDFFRDPNDPLHEHVEEINHHNWDTIASVNFEMMLQSVHRKYQKMRHELRDVKSADHSPRLLILEGILVLNVTDLANLMDPDVPGYFDLIVWPMYEKYSALLEDQKTDIKFFDGTRPTEETVQTIVRDLKSRIPQKDIEVSSNGH